MPRSSSPSRKQTHLTPRPFLPVPKPTPLAPMGSRMLPPSSFGQTMKEGLAFGAGQAVAHRAVGSLFGIFGSADKPSTPSPLPCEKERAAFESCMKTKSSDDFCGTEQVAYSQCIRLTGTASEAKVHETT